MHRCAQGRSLRIGKQIKSTRACMKGRGKVGGKRRIISRRRINFLEFHETVFILGSPQAYKCSTFTSTSRSLCYGWITEYCSGTVP